MGGIFTLKEDFSWWTTLFCFYFWQSLARHPLNTTCSFKLFPHRVCLSDYSQRLSLFIFHSYSGLYWILCANCLFAADSHKIKIPSVHFFSSLNFFVDLWCFRFPFVFFPILPAKAELTKSLGAIKVPFCHQIYSYTMAETQTEHFRFEAFDWFNLIHLHCYLLPTEFYFREI